MCRHCFQRLVERRTFEDAHLPRSGCVYGAAADLLRVRCTRQAHLLEQRGRRGERGWGRDNSEAAAALHAGVRRASTRPRGGGKKVGRAHVRRLVDFAELGVGAAAALTRWEGTRGKEGSDGGPDGTRRRGRARRRGKNRAPSAAVFKK